MIILKPTCILYELELKMIHIFLPIVYRIRRTDVIHNACIVLL